MTNPLRGFSSCTAVVTSFSAYAAALASHSSGTSRSPLLAAHHSCVSALQRYTLSGPSQSWLQRIRPYLQYGAPRLDAAGVYVLLSPFTKHFYVGCASNFRQRLDQHLRSVHSCARSLAPVHRLMRSLGSHALVLIPLVYAGPTDDLPTLERRMIRILQPTLNVRDIPSHRSSNCRLSAHRRWRARQSIPHPVSVPPAPALVSSPARFLPPAGVPTYDLCAALRDFEPDDHYLLFHCSPGYKLYDSAQLRMRFGASHATLTTVDGIVHHGPLRSLVKHLDRAKSLFLYPFTHDPRAAAANFLRRMLRFQRNRKALYTLSLERLILLLRSSSRLPRSDAAKCRLAVHKACLTRFGFDLRPLSLRLPVTCTLPRRYIHAKCEHILSTLQLPPALLSHTLCSLRVVRTTPRPLRDLCNHRRAARSHLSTHPPSCSCHLLRGLFPLDPDGHVCFRGTDTSNAFLPALKHSAKTVPSLPLARSADVAALAFVTFARQAWQFSNAFNPAPRHLRVAALPSPSLLLPFQTPPHPAALTTPVVTSALSLLSALQLVCVPLDRNPNSLFVECPLRYWRRLDLLFVQDRHYSRVATPHIHLLSDMHQRYKALGWHKRCPWNSKGTLCSSYALPKHKGPATKSRPVVPAHKHPARRFLQAVSLVFMRLIAQHTAYPDHFNITATKDVVPAFAAINKRLRPLPGDTGMLTFDVKNMYTELPHDAIRSASAHFLQWSRSLSRRRSPSEWLVDVRRRRVYASRHQYDASRCVRIRLSDLLDAVAFELDNIFFTVGDVTLQQRLGVSMGGYLSPAMAMMTCMVAERRLHRTLGADAKYISGIRYMDDAALIFRIPRNTPLLLERLRACALSAYPQGMQCEVTFEGQRCRMLELDLSIHDGLIAVAHRNKNAEAFMTHQQPPFLSFLPFSSVNGVVYFNGWFKGSISRILSNTCSMHPLHTLSFSIVVFFLECTYLGYPRTWFLRALRAFHPTRDDVLWQDVLTIVTTIMGGIHV